MIHVDFEKHAAKRGRCTDYTFIDRHTSEEIAFGSYNNGSFELLRTQLGGIEQYVSAAVAWTALNKELAAKYGY